MPQKLKTSPNLLVRVAKHQSLVDIAIQEGGSVESLFELAVINDISITDTLLTGALIRKPSIIDREIVEVFKRNIKPASDYLDTTILQEEGIDYWIIENNFIVS